MDAEQLVINLTLAFSVTLVALLAQVRIASRANPVLRVILMAQAIFWTISFVIRPIYLELAKPANTLLLADFRLAQNNYVQLYDIAFIGAIGQVAFTTTVAFALRVNPRCRSRPLSEFRTQEEKTPQDDTLVRVGFLLLSIGWIGRLLALTATSDLLSALNPFAIAGSIAIILESKSNVTGRTDKRGANWLVALVIIAEASWAFAFASKTALIAPLLALVVRLARTPGRLTARTLATFAATILITFLALQPLKGIDTAGEVYSRNPTVQGAVQSGAVSLLERFDGFSANTDAYYFPSTTWLSQPSFAELLVRLALPPGLASKPAESPGQLWNKQVRAATANSQESDVSLATGPTAEGYVQGRITGVVLANAALALLTLLVAHLLNSRSVMPRLAGAYALGTTTLYEQGPLGWAASANKAFQVVILGFLLISLFGWPRKKRPILNKTTHGLNHSPTTPFDNPAGEKDRVVSPPTLPASARIDNP